MTTQPTPGPWRVPKRSLGTIVGPDDILIAVASDADVDEPTQHANARQIAAAPELLKALKAAKPSVEADALRLIATIDPTSEEAEGRLDGATAVAEQVRAAIAKVTAP